MDTLFAKVAGLDLHRKSIQGAVRCRQESEKSFTQVRSFGTMTRDLRTLAACTSHNQEIGEETNGIARISGNAARSVC
jgi:hypothetical protein